MTTRVIQWIPQPPAADLAPAAVIGPPGPGWVEGSMPTFVQSTQPDHAAPYLWWDTSGDDLTLWIEDGN